MKRIILLAFPLTVLVSVTLIFAGLETQRVPDWQRELSAYITKSRVPDETITIQAVVEATKPWNLKETMGQAVPSDWTWSVNEVPFPPSAVQCVLLERHRPSTANVPAEVKRQVVFIGYHSDTLWRVGWLVHAGPKEPFTPEFMANLDVIGCDLGLW